MTSVRPRQAQAGLSLIELMIAMTLGLLLTAGIVSLFLSSSSNHQQQALLATLQEDARFAQSRMAADISMANAQYCSSTGGARSIVGGLALEANLLNPTVQTSQFESVMHDLTTAWGATSGTNTYPADPAAAYSWPSFLYMRGYHCTASSCVPVDPSTATDAGIPATGKAVGNRVIGSDVLTLRYLNNSGGWAIDGVHSTATPGSPNDVLTINPQSTETDTLAGGHVMMLASCNGAQVFMGALSGKVITPTIDLTGPAVTAPADAAPRLFDLNQDLLNVSYYLQVVSDGNGHNTGALMRRVNGDSSSAEILRGIERLDFSYGVLNSTGSYQFLSADQVDAVSNCASAEIQVPATTPGCLWRFVQAIRVQFLMDGQTPLYSLPANLQAYTYVPDGATPLAPANHSVTPTAQGFPVPMVRRGFSTVIAVRNVNP